MRTPSNAPKWTCTAATGLLAALLWAAYGQAAPIDMKQVSSDAKWVAHVDLDAVRASTVVQRAWHHALDKHKDAEQKLSFARTMLGFDPVKDVYGITFYGSEIGKPRAVTIISGAMNADQVGNLVSAIPGRDTTEYGDYDILSWTRKRHEHTHTVAAAFRGNKQLVLATSVDEVKKALDVLDGKAPGLTTDASLGGHVPDGTTLLLRVEGIKGPEVHSKAPVAKELRALRLVTGESAGQSFFRLRATMSSHDVAETGEEVVEGWKAQAALFMPDELVRKFAAALTPKVDGNAITLLWSAPADDVWQGVQKLEKMAEHHRAHHHGGHGCPLCAMCGGGHDEKGKSDKPQSEPKKKGSPEEDF